MNINVLGLYNRCKALPLGKQLFSAAFCLQAPYFMNIYPTVNDLRPGYANVSMNQRWSVQNHIKTVHAIAVCNLVEMSMGLIAEASIPKHLRWLPMGMDVTYTKKALGKLTAESTIDPEAFFKLDKYPGQVGVPVVVKDANDVVVTTATVRLWISEKPAKK